MNYLLYVYNKYIIYKDREYSNSNVFRIYIYILNIFKSK